MSVPDEIKDGPYKEVGTYQLAIRTLHAKGTNRASVTKTFHAYLELYFQCKHDVKIINYCRQKGYNKKDLRETDGTQVDRPKKDSSDIFAFYRDKGEVACENAARVIAEKWGSAKKAEVKKAEKDGTAKGKSTGTNDTVFVQGVKNIMAVQGVAQRDGYGYDVSFWYTSSDIYVTFHCYPK